MKIKFPVGDWSQDGHEKCNWYSVESNNMVVFMNEKITNFI